MITSLIDDATQYDEVCLVHASQPRSRRNGKVARLPAAVRELINSMLDQGTPYKLIIHKLGTPGQHINEDNISNWRLGGYQDYLKAQAINQRARVQVHAALALVRESGQLDITQLKITCAQVALLRCLAALAEHGEQSARNALLRNPAKVITLINACCNLSNTQITFEKRNWGTRASEPPSPSAPPTPKP